MMGACRPAAGSVSPLLPRHGEQRVSIVFLGHNVSNMQLKWLFLEGLVPLLGAGILYILWGIFRYLATDNKQSFSYEWWQAADPLGWLYGAVIIAVQSAMKCTTSENNVLLWMCVLGGLSCLLLLMAAMTDRGTKQAWKPPSSLQITAVLLVAAILYAGFQVRAHATGVTP
jgi:hypothetical protein